MRIYSIMLVKYENLFVMSINKKIQVHKNNLLFYHNITFFIIIGIYDNGISNGRMYNSCFAHMSCNFNKL